MGGGLMQLVAYGAQDIYLTGNPQITFFKVVYRRHTNFSMEAIIYFLAIATTDRVTQYANIYFTQYYRRAKLSLTGDDLLEMGMEPGPVFQSVFKALREAHIKGEIETREEEVALVRKQFL